MRLLVPEYPDLVRALLEFVTNESGHRGAFSLALLRHVAREPQAAQLFRDLFLKHADANPAFACHLIWRILDDSDLSPDWHQRLLEYVLDHWDAWKEHVAEFEEPGPDEMVNVVEGRLNDRTYPSSKKWIYLLCLPDGLGADAQAAREICVRESVSSVRFTAQVAKKILYRFWS